MDFEVKVGTFLGASILWSVWSHSCVDLTEAWASAGPPANASQEEAPVAVVAGVVGCVDMTHSRHGYDLKASAWGCD